MALISDDDRQTIREHFENNLTGDVEIVMFTEPVSKIIIPGRQPCETCEETEELLKEVTALSDKLSLTVHDIKNAREKAESYKIDRVPAFVLKGASRGHVRYFGIPAGYEFSTLIADLVDVSKGETGLAEETLGFLASLNDDVNVKEFTTNPPPADIRQQGGSGRLSPVHIKVFTTPNCPYCPPAARLAHQMAVESEYVTADVIEATEFPDLARRYGVRGVPKIVINDSVEFVGALPEAQFLIHVKTAMGNPVMDSKDESV